MTQRRKTIFITGAASGMGRETALLFASKGWFVGRQAEPAGIHMHLNPVHAESADEYLAHLREAVSEVRQSKTRAAGPTERSY